ncbi:mucolipin-2 [Bombina bombina]|uniref:mucolipin-2 n=1 Tax=Bombina bombina TaxID=8345 RepID=UPI00235A5802|nr:mucolipin-2 [Bombina bombina]
MDISLKCVGKGTAPASDPTLALLKMEREEHALKEDLKFYFMNPCDKYRARHQIPWKLLLQVLKIVMVTTQLVLFGLSNQLVVSFKEENTMAFKHLFLKGYTGTDEDDYSRTVYTQKDLYDSIFFAIDQYRQIENISLGTVGYDKDGRTKGLKICKQHYQRGSIHPFNDTFYIDPTVETDTKNCQTQKKINLRAILKEWNVVKNTDAYLQDSPNLLKILRDYSDLQQDDILVTMDVDSLYTVIPHVGGVEAVRSMVTGSIELLPALIHVGYWCREPPHLQ